MVENENPVLKMMKSWARHDGGQTRCVPEAMWGLQRGERLHKRMLVTGQRQRHLARKGAAESTVCPWVQGVNQILFRNENREVKQSSMTIIIMMAPQASSNPISWTDLLTLGH